MVELDLDVYKRQGLTYKEDIHSGARAAARGGFTTVAVSYTHLDLLLSLNCRIFQGYLYSPAVPPARLVRFVQDQDSAG